MEDDLNCFGNGRVEDDLNFQKMEDDLNFFENGRRTHFFFKLKESLNKINAT